MYSTKFSECLLCARHCERHGGGGVGGGGISLGNKRIKIPALVEFNCISLPSSCDNKTNRHRN